VKWLEIGTASVSGGALHMHASSTTFDIVTSEQKYSLVNSVIQAKLTIPVYGPATTTKFTFEVVEGSGTNGLSFFFSGNSTTLWTRYTVDSVDSDVSITYDAATMAYMRFREYKSIFYWETSPDSMVWTTQRQEQRVFNPNPVYTKFTSGYTGAEASLTMDVDDYNTILVQPYGDMGALQVYWQAYNPFQFNVSGHGFDQGRFGSFEFSNPAVTFTFNDATKGFNDGYFAFQELADTTVYYPGARKLVFDLEVGREYTASVWVYVPTGSQDIILGVVGGSSATATAVNDAWVNTTLTFTATSPFHILEIRPEASPSSGSIVFLDTVMFYAPDEDVTLRTLNVRTPFSIRYGRDQLRSLSDVAPARTNLELLNTSQDYSPDNTTSPVYGRIGPGKATYISATFQGQQYDIFNGYLDDYQLIPDIANRSVQLTAVDFLGRMGEMKLSTSVYPALLSGLAIHVILDEIGWPVEQRDIDSGASSFTWWSEEGTTALEAVKKIVKSEGLPAIAYVNQQGVFVFRDRHHRLIRDESKNLQTIFSDDGTEPGYSIPFNYDIGWRDLVNDVTYTITERHPKPGMEVVYEETSPILVSPNSTITLTVKADNPFINAATPEEDLDYVVLSGSATIALTRSSGTTTGIKIIAGGSGVSLSGMVLRATLIENTRTYQVHSEDSTSISKYGRKTLEESLPWTSYNDATPLVEIVLGQRAERLPVISFQVNNGEDERLTTVLNRKISDRIHLTETETFSDHDYYIEQIEHKISEAGMYQSAGYGCERVRDQVENVFTFDVAAQGFNNGVFGYSGISSLDNLLILDQSNLNEGLLGY
jgi:hypothetical protein